MTEESAPNAEAEQPASEETPPGTGDPEGTPPEPETGSEETPETDWEKRYADLQPEYTRASQEAARYREVFQAAQEGDKEAQAALLAAAGYQLPEDTSPGDENLTTEERLERRLEQLETERAQEREQHQQAEQVRELEEAEQRFYESELGKLDPKGEWSDEYNQLVVSAAQMFPDDEGLPDLEAGHKALSEQFESEFKKRVQSKRQPQAPSGASASEQPDLDDREQRIDYMERRLAEEEHSPVA